MMHNQSMLRFCAYCCALLLVLAGCDVVDTAPSPATAPVAAPPMQPATPVAAPTPLPAPELFARAMAARTIGDDDAAAQDLSALLETYPAAPEARATRYYLAESYARRGRWTSAVAAFRALLDEPARDELSAPALFWLARGYEAAGDWTSAVAAYERYRALQTPLEPYAAMRQAAQQRELGQLAEAAANFEHAAAAPIVPGERAGSYEKAIALRRQLGQPERALQNYVHLLQIIEQPGYRARILAEGAALAQQLGRSDQARAWLLEIVAVAGATAQAAAAVDQLRAANDTGLSAESAARVYFAVERYAEALPWFETAIAQTPAGSDTALELQRLRGMTLRSLGRFPEALEALAAVGGASPNSEPGRQAQLDWVQTIGQSGETLRAIEGYRQYAAAYPTDPRAPEALNRVALLYDRLGDVESAMQARLDLGLRFPQSDQAPPALHRAGLFFLRAGRPAEARSAWQQLADTRQGYEQARGAFWAARVAQQQGDTQVSALFELARAAAPDSYYGARAADELGMTFTPSVALDALISADEWRELAAWVAAWPGQPAAEAIIEGYAAVRDSDVVARALGLEQVGLQAESIAEWNHARATGAKDPPQLLHLGRLAHEHNVAYIGLKVGEQLALAAPANAPPAPIALRRLIFPAPYADLVVVRSREEGVDPRLFYALMRQESLFNPGATSWVGARGLAQVMPSTGEGIAQRLGVTNFAVDDLYRPVVSVRFGAFYIGQRLLDMQGSIQGALSAYNGGLGNAQRWAGGNYVADPDLFTEGIDFAETNHYVKLVYGYYGVYQQLYALP